MPIADATTINGIIEKPKTTSNRFTNSGRAINIIKKQDKSCKYLPLSSIKVNVIELSLPQISSSQANVGIKTVTEEIAKKHISDRKVITAE